MIGEGRRPSAQQSRPRAQTAAGRTRPAAASKRRRRLGLRRPPRIHPRLIGALLVLVAIAVGGWFWLRDSSLVAVRKVTITGVSGPDAGQIRAALTSAAHGMTTLDVNSAALRNAVQPFPVVKHVQASTSFPHAMVITVSEEVPVAMLSAGGTSTAVAGDGALLHGASAPAALPTITVAVAPGGDRVTGMALADARLLAAAPYPLLARIASASDSQAHGLTVQLRNGPRVYFGSTGQLARKWSVADGVIAQPSSAGADYIDVTVPARPVAGVGPDSAANTGPVGAGSTTPQSTAPGSTTPAASGATSASTTPGAGSTAAGSTNPAGG